MPPIMPTQVQKKESNEPDAQNRNPEEKEIDEIVEEVSQKAKVLITDLLKEHLNKTEQNKENDIEKTNFV